MTKDWRSTLMAPGETILSAIQTINQSSLQVALIVDGDGKLQGMVTDGDIRRAILRGIPLSDPVEKIMSTAFTVVSTRESREEILALMRERDLRHIPVLDDAKRIVDLKVLMNMVATRSQPRNNWVVLMAGGLGSRLRPLTDDYPKPLLNVGGKPLLETIITNVREYGFWHFFIAVNYKADMIEEYFGDGSRWEVKITYLREKKPMGTAGALRLLPDPPGEPLLVMNSDLLTKVNFRHLLDFHADQKSMATMGVREISLNIPYGVVNADGFRLLQLEEKPVKKVFVNAGIYVLEPPTLELIPKDVAFDMTTFFERAREAGFGVNIFPIHEYWLDIGRACDYEQANGDFCKHFE